MPAPPRSRRPRAAAGSPPDGASGGVRPSARGSACIPASRWSGNVGARNRINYTLVGAVANQASRLESLNKIYGTEILASGEIAAATADRLVWRHLDRIVAAGTTETLDIHELLGEIGDAPQHAAFLEAWQAARKAYGEGPFRRGARGLSRGTGAAAARQGGPYLRRALCRARPRHATPPDWDGVWHFDKK